MKLDWDEYQSLVKQGRSYGWSVGVALKSSESGTELQHYYLYSELEKDRFCCRNADEVRVFFEGVSRERKRIGIFSDGYIRTNMVQLYLEIRNVLEGDMSQPTFDAIRCAMNSIGSRRIQLAMEKEAEVQDEGRNG